MRDGLSREGATWLVAEQNSRFAQTWSEDRNPAIEYGQVWISNNPRDGVRFVYVFEEETLGGKVGIENIRTGHHDYVTKTRFRQDTRIGFTLLGTLP